jgi:aminoglycoside phosphotransferase (APT) family kinase protein
MNDIEVAAKLLSYLAQKFDCAGLAYATPPARISGGYDAAIFGFVLQDAPPALQGPLILRLNRLEVGADRVALEAIVHNWLAGQGFAIPDVRVAEIDPALLGGRFTVMTRIAGKPLGHEIERVLGSGTILTKVAGLARIPAIVRGVTEAWVDAQIKLHALDPAPLLAAVAAGGLDPALITFDGQLARTAAAVRQYSLDGLQPVVDWLAAHKPSSLRATVCHGDFHPLNILGEDGHVTGVIDWVNAVVAPAEMDVGSAIANIASAPLGVPAVLNVPVQMMMAYILRRYRAAYEARRPLDDQAVRYFQTFRCVVQLVPVLINRATGGTGGGAFGSPRGVERLVRRIRVMSGVVVTGEPPQP